MIRWRLNWVSMFVTDLACCLAAVKPLFPLQKIHSKDCLFWEQVGFFPPIWECFDSEKLRVAQLESQRWIEELKHQKYLSNVRQIGIKSERGLLFAYLCAVLSYSLSGCCPGLEQHHSWDECQCHQQTTSRTNEREGSTAKQPVHWESSGRTGPPDSIFPSHFLCMCLSYYFIFSLWIPSGQQNSDRNVVLAANDRHSQILSYYLSLNC